MHAEGRIAVELERFVGLEEMIVAADLHRAVAGIGHPDAGLTPSGIQLDFALGGDDFTGPHLIGFGNLLLARADRVMHGHQLGAVGKHALDLDHRHHIAHAWHNIVAVQDRRAEADEIGDRAPVARALENFIADIGNGFGVVELEAARAALAGQFGGAEDEQPLGFRRRQKHVSPLSFCLFAVVGRD